MTVQHGLTFNPDKIYINTYTIDLLLTQDKTIPNYLQHGHTFNA